MKRGFLVPMLGLVAAVAGCAHTPDPPECMTAACQEQNAEDAVRRAAAARAFAGHPVSFEQEARDLDAVRREFCFKDAMNIQDTTKQVAAVKACRDEWPERPNVVVQTRP